MNRHDIKKCWTAVGLLTEEHDDHDPDESYIRLDDRTTLCCAPVEIAAGVVVTHNSVPHLLGLLDEARDCVAMVAGQQTYTRGQHGLAAAGKLLARIDGDLDGSGA